MSRNAFFKKVIQYILLMALAMIAIFLGNRVVTGNECSACPGSGICKGESDCSKFLSESYGREEE